ncbi:GDCCVxC domain-containing (seleno)protein [Leisingera daeponensis]|nr:GDCCVxC domain-containing (seleno)protein [Leisingera daeponensis]
MPQDASQWFYQCPASRALPRPRPGDCCIYCSYRTGPCPPVQLGNCRGG